MIRYSGKLVLIAWSVFAVSVDCPAYAQTATLNGEAWYYRCPSWTPATWDKKGVRRLLFPIPHEGGKARVQLRGGYVQKGRNLTGRFEAIGDFSVALLSEPAGGKPTLQFVTRVGSKIDFYADGSTTPIRAHSGRLMGYQIPPEFLSAPEIYSVACIKGNSSTALEDAEEIGKAATRKPIADLFVDRSRPSPEPSAGQGKLGEIFSRSPAPVPLPSVGATEAPSGGSVKPAQSAPSRSADRDSRAPAVKGGGSATTAVCRLDTLEPLAVPNGVTLTPPQMVGIRNRRMEAWGFDYLSAGGDVISLNTKFDVADSAGKLIPYEAVTAVRRSAGSLLWVSIAASNPRAARVGAVATRPAHSLRVIVVGAAQELSVSALDLVGAELEKQSEGRIKLEIEWHIIDESGSIRPAGRFSSMENLVRAAADKAGGQRSDVLNESQLATLFDDFESLLTAQRRVIDKVFWIKGAYPIPSSMPRRFEKFITTVSASSSVARMPTGQAPKWLVVITARMPGFSIAYLKEPVYSLQIGDVIEESASPGTGPRQLIGDVGLLATRMRTELISQTAGKPDSGVASDSGVPAGKLVIDAKEVFTQRGYVLSPHAATAVQVHLQRVLNLWNGSTLNSEALAEFGSKVGKSAPSMTDILQGIDEKYPRLPKTLPDWVRKPLKDLTPGEGKIARTFVAKYLSGAARVVAVALRGPATSADCGLFFVADKQFGFGR